MAGTQCKADRNASILRRKIRGESLKKIATELDDVTYARVVDIARAERERITQKITFGDLTVLQAANEYGLTELEINQLVEEEADRKARLEQENREKERLREIEIEKFERELYQRDLGDFWRPISDCPEYVFSAILFDGLDVFVGSRCGFSGKWKVADVEVFPTHFIRLPSPPKEY